MFHKVGLSAVIDLFLGSSSSLFGDPHRAAVELLLVVVVVPTAEALRSKVDSTTTPTVISHHCSHRTRSPFADLHRVESIFCISASFYDPSSGAAVVVAARVGVGVRFTAAVRVLLLCSLHLVLPIFIDQLHAFIYKGGHNALRRRLVYKRMREQFGSRRPLLRVLYQTFGYEVFERVGPVSLAESWRWALWNEEDGPHRMYTTVRRLADSTFDRGDAERPDVGFRVVSGPLLCEDFRGHPVGCADDCLRLGKGVGELFRDPEVGEFAVSFVVEQNVRGLNVAVNFLSFVEILEPEQRVLHDYLYLLLLKSGLADGHEVTYCARAAVLHRDPYSSVLFEAAFVCHNKLRFAFLQYVDFFL
mmetsp:Transcript_2298/g.4234  ORF Transcript_2298/g.4234 Transcript_2298/m.4234 type:complete len:360 (-) Transcript_2298:348-1427(-)